MRLPARHRLCRRPEGFGRQHRGTRVGETYERTFILYHRRPAGHHHRHPDRPHGTLLPEEPARGGVRDAGQRRGLQDRDAPRRAEERRHAGRELRAGGRPRGPGRRSGDGQPQRDHPTHGAHAGERDGLQAVRADQLHHPGAGPELPAGRPRGEQLPELRLPAGAHQRPGRPLHADTDRLAPGVQRTGGGVWPGADPRQHD